MGLNTVPCKTLEVAGNLLLKHPLSILIKNYQSNLTLVLLFCSDVIIDAEAYGAM